MQNSHGRRVHYSAEGVRNFCRWFGGSKVVDGEGRPIVVYHGSPSPSITAFSRDYEGANTGAADAIHGLGGFYFTNDPNVADTYARTFEVVGADIAQQEFGIPLRDDLPQSTTYPAFLAIRNPKYVTGPVTEAVLREAKESSNDGVIARIGRQIEYVVFRPEQIKSAIGNSGAFNPASPDLCDVPSVSPSPKPILPRRRFDGPGF